MSADRARPSPRVVGAVPALRVLLQWDDGVWSVKESEPVRNKVFMASARLPRSANVTGFWYELVAADGAVLHRQVRQDPARQRVHIRRQDGSYTGAPLRRSRALLQILVPAEPADAVLQIWGQQVSVDRRVPHAQVLARLSPRHAGRARDKDA
jgi:hypothetical protein